MDKNKKDLFEEGEKIKTPDGEIGHIRFTEYGEIRVVVDGEWQRWTYTELLNEGEDKEDISKRSD